MDALKKAEEEKKKAAKRLEEVEADSGLSAEDGSENSTDDSNNEEAQEPEKIRHTAALSLEPLAAKPQDEVKEPIVDVEPEPVESGISQRETPTVDASETYSDDLTLENTISTDELDDTQQEIDLNDTTIIEGLSTEDSSAPFDDTFHGVILDEEEAESAVYEETLPGVPADQLAKDLESSGYQTTPVAAQTVFSAGKDKSNSFHWGIMLVLGILAISSFAVFYYFTITPVARKMPSPMVARGIETVPQPLPPVMPVTEDEVITGTIIDSEQDIQNTTNQLVDSQIDTSTTHYIDDTVTEGSQDHLQETEEQEAKGVTVNNIEVIEPVDINADANSF